MYMSYSLFMTFILFLQTTLGEKWYYKEILHLLDRVPGALHHWVPQDTVPHGCWLCHRSDTVPRYDISYFPYFN